MSLAVLHVVWDHFDGEGSELLLALALADFCGDNAGSMIYPSIETLADRTRLDRRTVQRLMRRLEARGWLQCVTPGIRGRSMTRRYRIDPAFMAKALPPIGKGGAAPPISPKRAAFDAEKGGVAMPPELNELKNKSDFLKGQTQKTCSVCGGGPAIYGPPNGSRWFCLTHDPVLSEARG